MEHYISITLGPVFDTVNLASSPAALWTGSYLFSYLSKTICRLLTQNGISEEDILSPYYTNGSDVPTDCDGVGLYHDRIVFKKGSFDIADFPAIRQAAIEHVAQTFGVEDTYLQEYLLIAAADCKTDCPILDSSVVMDSLELAKPIVSQRSTNPLLSLLVGEQNHGNENIKALDLVKGFQNWQLRRPDGSLKSISQIAGEELRSGMKKHRYYAIVRADGDRMGDIIKGLSADQIRDFSKKCIFYCADIARLVRSYNGVAIYSGGDDLLAILPCETADGRTVFQFLQEANSSFTKAFSAYPAKVSLSFGVTICYHKFPLYEALADSQTMLFDIAKEKRDCAAIHIQKHAGQSECLVVANAHMGALLDFYQESIANTDSDWIHSAHHKLHTFRRLFAAAGEDAKKIGDLFMNLFDADSHQGNQFVHKKLPDFYIELATQLDITCVDPTAPSNTVSTLAHILRLLKFFTEKEGERE